MNIIIFIQYFTQRSHKIYKQIIRTEGSPTKIEPFVHIVPDDGRSFGEVRYFTKHFVGHICDVHFLCFSRNILYCNIDFNNYSVLPLTPRNIYKNVSLEKNYRRNENSALLLQTGFRTTQSNRGTKNLENCINYNTQNFEKKGILR